MEDPASTHRVTITGIDIPFRVLFQFLLKLTLAALPVYLIVMVIAIMSMILITALTGGGMGFRL